MSPGTIVNRTSRRIDGFRAGRPRHVQKDERTRVKLALVRVCCLVELDRK